MKSQTRILLVILSIVCLFILCSCDMSTVNSDKTTTSSQTTTATDTTEEPTTTTRDPIVELANYNAVIANLTNSKPSSAKSTVTYDNGEDVLTSTYTITATGTVTYSIQTYKEYAIGDKNEDYIKTETGTFDRDAETTEVVTLANLSLDTNYFNDYYTDVESNGAKRLYINVKNENIGDVLGMEIAAANLQITIKISMSGKVNGVTLTYEAAEGAMITVDTTYSY